MQRLEGLLRKAVQDYEMIAPGDRVCVGVSGGKDSVALTVALGHLRRYLGVPFEVMAVTLDPRFGGVEAVTVCTALWPCVSSWSTMRAKKLMFWALS